MPQRGSGPSVAVTTVPSGCVIRVTPSAPYVHDGRAPDGSVVVEREPPPGSCSASNIVSLPISDVRLTRYPVAVSLAREGDGRAALSWSVFRRPVAAS